MSGITADTKDTGTAVQDMPHEKVFMGKSLHSAHTSWLPPPPPLRDSLEEEQRSDEGEWERGQIHLQGG